MDAVQALSLGALQGFSELFPISSLGQTILLPALIGWQFDRKDTDFLAFLVALHLATATALLIYFCKDWKVVIRGLRRQHSTAKNWSMTKTVNFACNCWWPGRSLPG